MISLTIDGLPGAYMSVAEMPEIQGRSADIAVEPDKLRSLHLYVTQSANLATSGQERLKIMAHDKQSAEQSIYAAQFDVPGGTK